VAAPRVRGDHDHASGALRPSSRPLPEPVEHGASKPSWDILPRPRCLPTSPPHEVGSGNRCRLELGKLGVRDTAVKIAITVFELRHPQDTPRCTRATSTTGPAYFCAPRNSADFYRRPVEVCQCVGRVRRRIGDASRRPRRQRTADHFDGFRFAAFQVERHGMRHARAAWARLPDGSLSPSGWAPRCSSRRLQPGRRCAGRALHKPAHAPKPAPAPLERLFGRRSLVLTSAACAPPSVNRSRG
jgi:hypothetical protein